MPRPTISRKLQNIGATRGTVSTRDVLNAYVDHVMSFIDPSIIKPFNVVLDAGSGMGGLIAPKLFEKLPCKTTRLCFEIDGRFPNHEANPLIDENRVDITERVIAEKADIGIAWDGDADRCFFLDGTGEFISGDFITALLAQAFLLKAPGSTIIYDLRASNAVRDIVAAHGGTSLMNRVGHAFFKKRMRETNGIFGGEVTGHYYFRDNFFADNGFIPALLILELMSKQGKSLRDLLEPVLAVGVDGEELAADAGVLVGASGAVGSDAVAEFDAPPAEVVGEDLELIGGGLAVLLPGTGCAPPFEELVVVVEDVLGVDGDVALGGVEAAVPGELRGDVDGELVGHELG